MRRAATRVLLLCLVGLLLTSILLAGAPPTALAVNTYESKILETFGDDLIAYWPLSETEGSTAYDVSGNSYNLTISGVTLDAEDGPGETMGRAGYWDGINDVVGVDGGALLTAFPRTTGTVVAWFKIPADVWASAWFYTAWEVGHYEGAPQTYMGALKWIEISRFTARRSALVLDYSTSTTEWFCYIVTYNTADKMRAYFDTIEVGSGVDYEALPDTINRWRIGSTIATAFFFQGNVSHVFVINRVANEDERASACDPEPLPFVATPTPTPLPLSHYMTLESGQPVRLDYSATAGDMLIGTLLLVFVALLAFLAFLGLSKR